MKTGRNGHGEEPVRVFGFEAVRVSLLASVGGGRLPDDVESPMEYRWIRPVHGAKRSDHFGYVRVIGDSLIGDGIESGDILIIRTNCEQYDLTPGRLAVVGTPFGMMAKHVYTGLNGHIRLVSSNPLFDDLILESDQVSVLGIIVRRETDLG
jgi:SOS-response transcriptional repressor LexA